MYALCIFAQMLLFFFLLLALKMVCVGSDPAQFALCYLSARESVNVVTCFVDMA